MVFGFGSKDSKETPETSLRKVIIIVCICCFIGGMIINYNAGHLNLGTNLMFASSIAMMFMCKQEML